MVLDYVIAKLKKSDQGLETSHYYELNDSTEDRVIIRDGSLSTLENILLFNMNMTSNNKVNQIKLSLLDRNEDLIIFYKNYPETLIVLTERISRTYPSRGITGIEGECIEKFYDFTKKGNETLVSIYLIKQLLDHQQGEYLIKRAENPGRYEKNWRFYILEESGSSLLKPKKIENCLIDPSVQFKNGIMIPIAKEKNVKNEIPSITAEAGYSEWLGACLNSMNLYMEITNQTRIRHFTLDDRTLLLDKQGDYIIVMEVSNTIEGRYEEVLVGNEREAMNACKDELANYENEESFRERLNIRIKRMF